MGTPPLESRLPFRQNDPLLRLQPLPIALLSKYIAFVREFVHPCLTEAAKHELLAFYVDLRRRSRAHANVGLGGGNSTSTSMPPVTTRAMEALVRLTEARARMEARAVATAADALDAIDVFKGTLFDFFGDGPGGMGMGIGGTMGGFPGAFPSQGNKTAQTKAFKQALLALVSRSGPVFDLVAIRAMGEGMGMQRTDVTRMLDTLNAQGILLMKGPNTYQYIGDY